MLFKAGFDLHYWTAPSKIIWWFHLRIGRPSFLRPLIHVIYIHTTISTVISEFHHVKSFRSQNVNESWCICFIGEKELSLFGTFTPQASKEGLDTGCAIPILDNLSGSKWPSNILYMRMECLNIIKKTHHLV